MVNQYLDGDTVCKATTNQSVMDKIPGEAVKTIIYGDEKHAGYTYSTPVDADRINRLLSSLDSSADDATEIAVDAGVCTTATFPWAA